jgi:transcriptional antiterminator Rof (Rho-off)
MLRNANKKLLFFRLLLTFEGEDGKVTTKFANKKKRAKRRENVIEMEDNRNEFEFRIDLGDKMKGKIEVGMSKAVSKGGTCTQI